MKVFTCSYSCFSLAIPMDFVSSIFLHSDNSNNKIHYTAENGDMYISLPMLFDCPNINIKHGVILRNNNNDSQENKVILLSAEVERERDIPAENFYQVPKIMSLLRFSKIFNGIFFHIRSHDESNNKLIKELGLLLDPQQLVQNIQKELIL
jgi:hypothetical protein